MGQGVIRWFDHDTVFFAGSIFIHFQSQILDVGFWRPMTLVGKTFTMPCTTSS